MPGKRQLVTAWLLGVNDGYKSGRAFSGGITWGDERDESYDAGVNTGQSLRTIRARGYIVHQTGQK